MVDVIEIPAPAVDQLGMLTIWWVPTIADVTAPKVTEVKATGSKKITYSFTPGGWKPTSTQSTLKDPRLTLVQDLESLDKVVQGLTLEYVDSDDANSAAVVLVPGLSGYFVERRKVLNKTDIAVSQKVRVFAGTLGNQNFVEPGNAGKFLIQQTVALSNIVGGPVAMVA